jgi:hypothetical protein
MSDDRVPVEFPENFDEMLARLSAAKDKCVGWCLLCDRAIATEADLIPGTDTHDCPEGRTLERKMR